MEFEDSLGDLVSSDSDQGEVNLIPELRTVNDDVRRSRGLTPAKKPQQDKGPIRKYDKALPIFRPDRASTSLFVQNKSETFNSRVLQEDKLGEFSSGEDSGDSMKDGEQDPDFKSINHPKEHGERKRSAGQRKLKNVKWAEREKEEHLSGRWRTPWQRNNPEYMTESRRKLEEKYNPLIKLLNVKIELVDDKNDAAAFHSDIDSLKTSASESDTDRKRPKRRPVQASTTFSPPFRIASPPNKEITQNSDTDFPHDTKQIKVPETVMIDESDAPEAETDPSEPDVYDDKLNVAHLSSTERFKILNGEPETEDDEPFLARGKAFTSHFESASDEEPTEVDAMTMKIRLKMQQKEEEERQHKLQTVLQEIRKSRESESRGQDRINPAKITPDEEKVMDGMSHDIICDPELYPRKVSRGRPKFMVQNLLQDSIGPLSLGDGSHKVPASISKFLRPYQREGVQFLYRQYKEGIGGILGDDMGLGKTIQVIAFLAAIMEKTGFNVDGDRRKNAITAVNILPPPRPSSHGPTCLIACPSSVVHNWAREFETWGYFDIAIFESSSRADTLGRFSLGYVDVVIASLEAVRDRIKDFASQDFSIVIADEVHRLKNPRARTTWAFNTFPTRLRYGLTGTALQNRYGEFWSILNWAVPGKVGNTLQWDLYVSKPLKFAQKSTGSDEVIAHGRIRAMALVSILLPHFWLRRTKDEVKIQLPEKHDNIILCPLTPLQKGVYMRLLELKEVRDIVDHDLPCDCGRRDPKNGSPYQRGKCCGVNWSSNIFGSMILFQKVSNHLALIYPDKEDRLSHPQKYDQEVNRAKLAFPDDWETRKPTAIVAFDSTLCGKWNVLQDMLTLWHKEGDKVLIFSMSLKILSLLKTVMDQTRWTYVSLDGSVPADQRMGLVDQFNHDPNLFCFLIATRAGGIGLNLTAANKVVIFDPNWNPSHDLQAMDRAYRFGQTRDVDVYRLIGAGTLEELVYNRQQYKRQQAGVAYDARAERRMYTGVEGAGKENQGELFGVKNIFKFHENGSLTEKVIRDCDIAELEYALKNTVMATGASPQKPKGDKSKEGRNELKGVYSDYESDNEPPVDDQIALDRLMRLDRNSSSNSSSREDDEQRSQKSPTSMVKKTVETEMERRRREAKVQIDAILSGNQVQTSIVSDLTLGGSKTETDHVRQAVAERGRLYQKKRDGGAPPTFPVPSRKLPPNIKLRGSQQIITQRKRTHRTDASSSSSSDGENQRFDPLNRVKAKLKRQAATTTTTVSSSKVTLSETVTSGLRGRGWDLLNHPDSIEKATKKKVVTVAASMNIDTTNVSWKALIEPSGYIGVEGGLQLSKELSQLKADRHTKRITQILQTYLHHSS